MFKIIEKRMFTVWSRFKRFRLSIGIQCVRCYNCLHDESETPVTPHNSWQFWEFEALRIWEIWGNFKEFWGSLRGHKKTYLTNKRWSKSCFVDVFEFIVFDDEMKIFGALSMNFENVKACAWKRKSKILRFRKSTN